MYGTLKSTVHFNGQSELIPPSARNHQCPIYYLYWAHFLFCSWAPFVPNKPSPLQFSPCLLIHDGSSNPSAMFSLLPWPLFPHCSYICVSPNPTLPANSSVLLAAGIFLGRKKKCVLALKIAYSLKRKKNSCRKVGQKSRYEVISGTGRSLTHQWGTLKMNKR